MINYCISCRREVRN